ncbi:MAG: YdcF family protein [gamma proteobacterium symbiont of Bathyaustriella thionipta]|nr:YdcF family protein [gamma proteobacterium symbiont of Bathyaustriella thionipta]MCU7948725.1 YdcF family protein [gamma proteobacterium symbiont of Bathyaustriella thionipta]MCU7954628.1 YdcF family protein [gamma proteobacterium symbiont of Bathyaustriella thionipta]MCU7955208.1 YdcF family protein [gamma proteobacterium symbiont of Bathyaustriella thionipta]MCU7968244.1 YdcF family protein [gamma proteobacterium symbiont of Bathyaustriella thionipta]
MSQYLTRIVELLFFPPGIFIFLLLISLLWIKNIKLLKHFLSLQVLFIYCLTIPVTGHYLFKQLENIPPLSEAQIKNNKVDAIVILAGGIKTLQQEYQGPDIGYFTQLRLRYGAWLQKRTDLPVIVTGGIARAGITEAELMAQVLRNEYGLQGTILVEKQSKNTFGNALYSSKIAKEEGFQSLYLVTSAFHMPRALASFKQHNKAVIAAPMGFYHNTMGGFSLGDFLPNSNAMRENYLALHELIGRYWYQLYY